MSVGSLGLSASSTKGKSFDLRIDHNCKDVAAFFAEFGSSIVEQASITATNKTMSIVARDVKREIRARTNAPAKLLGERMKVYRASSRKLFSRLFIGTKPMPVTLLGAKHIGPQGPRGRGVSWSGGALGRQYDPHGFIATMRDGHTGAYKRKGPERLPIMQITIDIYSVALAEVTRIMNNSVPTIFDIQFRNEVEARTNKRIARMNK